MNSQFYIWTSGGPYLPVEYSSDFFLCASQSHLDRKLILDYSRRFVEA